MPIIRVELFAGRTKDQKAKLAKEITDAVCRIAVAPPEACLVVFTDIPKENYAQAGKLACEK